MARSISISRTLIPSCKSISPFSRRLSHRYQSSSSSSSDSSTDPVIVKLEEAIQSIVARRSAPDWLPFSPGASYWVPPPPSFPSLPLTHLIHSLSLPHASSSSSPLASPPAWPSPSYFIQGSAPHLMEIEASYKCNSQSSEDEEG